MKMVKAEMHFLMAEDNPADAELFSEMLEIAFNGKQHIHCVDRFEKIIDALSKNTFDALILDMNLPDKSGIKNVSQLVETHPTLPIIVLTGQKDMELAVDSLHEGAQDYLPKNIVNPDLLARSLRYACERKQIEIQLREALNQAATQNSQLETIAKYDNLTGLPNRAYFNDAAKHMLNRASRSHSICSLLYFDLDNFKRVNDTYGHFIGDELLRQVAKRLSLVVRTSDILARIGGDEFVILTDMLSTPDEVYPLVKRINQSFSQPFNLEQREIISSPSIGVAYFPDAADLDELIKQADRAMYEAKRNLKSTTCFYTSQMAERFSRRQRIEREMPQGLEKGEFETWFQPIFSQAKPEIIHIEALMRWHSPTLNWVSPTEFIPVAESSPLINTITELAVSDSSELLVALEKENLKIGQVSINICAMQLSNPAFCPLLVRWLRNNKIPPEKICLEITERQIIQNAESCARHIEELRKLGVQFALDDFGSGYSSITHLLDLPIDILKLDRILIDGIDKNERNQALTAGIVEMAHRLDMEVVAEGIERREEFDFIIQLGVDFLQGYGYAKPMHGSNVIDFYKSH